MSIARPLRFMSAVALMMVDVRCFPCIPYFTSSLLFSSGLPTDLLAPQDAVGQRSGRREPDEFPQWVKQVNSFRDKMKVPRDHAPWSSRARLHRNPFVGPSLGIRGGSWELSGGLVPCFGSLLALGRF